MPSASRENVLCRYQYDPLDRLASSTPSAQADLRRFYCKSRLTTEIQGAVQRSIFQHEDQLLAQLQHQSGVIETTLLATDQQRSVLNALDATQPNPLAYTPYGHRPLGNGLLSLLGFNGERPDPVTGHYLLGNGYRAFNPTLMRFNSPDSWSPFGKGGLNAYGYCGGDPINQVDPNGHSSLLLRFWKGLRNRIGVRTPSKFRTPSPVSTNSQTIKDPLGAPTNQLNNTTGKFLDNVKKTDSKNTIHIGETSIFSDNTHGNVSTPLKKQSSSDLTRNRLLNRRTKSLDHTPENSGGNIEAFYVSKQYDPDGDFLTSQFAANPTGTHARLYAAMYSEFSEFPTAQTQRTIRTGGQK